MPQFVNVTDEDSININDVIGTSGIACGVFNGDTGAAPDAAQIQIPLAAGGYNLCFYVSNAWKPLNPTDPDDEGTVVTGWCDANGCLICEDNDNIANGTIPVSTSIWTKGVTKSFSLTFVK